ncbi:nucleotidyltransferase family protein [Streptomyces odontomachi]|uniref:nucleotidyltransferase family protein n=1 Tax=Streptomyces odontomachi TaxID=2944940 RepID=UPI00210B8AAD|nr:nucleotidyltransferase family protein [Streptomyces sp. ODS25]
MVTCEGTHERSCGPAPLTLAPFFGALGLDPEEPLRNLVRGARELPGRLVPLVLSVAARQGESLGSGCTDEIRRMRARVEDYRALATHLLADIPGARVLKGPSLAERYPAGVLRPCGDLDVYVPDETALWRAAISVLGTRPVSDVNVTVLDGTGRTHWVVVLRWPGLDPVLDAEHRVELATFAYPGLPGVVPVRAEPPEDQAMGDLLALAEEAFQRSFTIKDVLDLAFTLDSAGCPAPAALAAAGERYRLTPELLRLAQALDDAEDVPRPAVNTHLLTLLRTPAAQELERRRVRSGQRDGATTGRPHVDTARPLHGLHLPAGPAPRPDDGAHFHEFADGVLLRCPVGEFLLVETELVDPSAYDSALAELRKLHAAEEALS